MAHDYYQILGIGPDADEKEIKKAYRAIIRYCHPDSPDCRMSSEELFEVQNAYETLMDPEKRARYDRTLKDPRREPPLSGRSRPAAGGAVRPRPSFLDEELSDLFSLFRNPFFPSPFDNLAAGGTMPDRALEIILTPAEALRGGLFEIAVPGPGGIPAGSITVRIPPGVRSGAETVVDLSGALGIGGRLRITVLVEDDR